MPNLTIPKGTVALPPLKKSERAARAVWQQRDVEILAALLEHKFLSRPILAQLFPSDPSRAPKAALAAWRAKNLSGEEGAPASRRGRLFNLDRRLRLLSEAGFLERFLLRLDGAIAYTLTTDGERFLKTRQPELPFFGAQWQHDRRVSRFHIAHTVGIAAARIAIAQGARELADIELVRSERENRDLRAVWKQGALPYRVVPDALVEFVLRDRPDRVLSAFLEIDRDSQSAARIQAKLNAYALLEHTGRDREMFGVRDFLVLFITDSPQRARQLLELAREAPDDKLVGKMKRRLFFCSETDFASVPANVLSRIWHSPGVPDPTTQVAFVPSPLPRR